MKLRIHKKSSTSAAVHKSSQFKNILLREETKSQEITQHRNYNSIVMTMDSDRRIISVAEMNRNSDELLYGREMKMNNISDTYISITKPLQFPNYPSLAENMQHNHPFAIPEVCNNLSSHSIMKQLNISPISNENQRPSLQNILHEDQHPVIIDDKYEIADMSDTPSLPAMHSTKRNSNTTAAIVHQLKKIIEKNKKQKSPRKHWKLGSPQKLKKRSSEMFLYVVCLYIHICLHDFKGKSAFQRKVNQIQVLGQSGKCDEKRIKQLWMCLD